jgi:uncharacterized protein with beta-barrel porin domain
MQAISTIKLVNSTGLSKTVKKIFNYFSILTILFGSTFGTFNVANAAAVVIANGATLTATQVDEAADTLANTATTVTASFNSAAAAITFATLTSADDSTLTLSFDDLTDANAETTDITGNITAGAGSTMALTVTDGLLDLGGSIIETTTGVVTLNVLTGQELNTTGSSKAFAAAITAQSATSILDIDGTATFSDTVGAGVLEINGVTTFSSTLVHTGTAAIAATTTVTGAYTGTGAANIDAALNLNGDASFNNSTETLLAHTLTFKGATLTATGTNGIETDAGAAKIVIDAAAGDQTIAAQITPDATNEAILENSNVAGTVTFNEKIGVVGGNLMELIDTDALTTSVFDKEVAAVLFTVDGTATLKLDNNQATNIDLNTAGKLIIDDTITNGQEVFLAGDSVVDGSVAGTGNIKLPSNLSNGQTLVILANVQDAAEAAVIVDVQLAIADTALRTFTVSNVDNATNDNDITVTASDRSAVAVATELGSTTNQGAALLQATIAASSDASLLDTFTNALNAEGGLTATDDTALAKQVAPQTDLISGSSVAAQAVTGSIQGIMSNRMASLRSGDAYFGTGVAAGGMSAQSGFIQVFGSTGEQKTTKVGSGNQAGFDTDTQGVAIGFDGVTDDGMTIGVSVATANTDVDGKGTGKSKNSIDTYSASLYMDRATDNGYVEGSLTFGVNENSTSRKITSAGLNRTLTGSYDSQSLSLNLTAGMPNEVGVGYLTPFGSFTATSMDIDAYTEKSTVADDALRLKIAQDDVNSMVGTVGLKYHAEMDNGGMPMISLAINNEFGDSAINSTNTFQGGGTAFKTTTAVEELSATLGLGYSYGTDAASIEFAYEADANDDEYLSHYGSIKIVGKF